MADMQSYRCPAELEDLELDHIWSYALVKNFSPETLDIIIRVSTLHIVDHLETFIPLGEGIIIDCRNTKF